MRGIRAMPAATNSINMWREKNLIVLVVNRFRWQVEMMTMIYYDHDAVD